MPFAAHCDGCVTGVGNFCQMGRGHFHPPSYTTRTTRIWGWVGLSRAGSAEQNHSLTGRVSEMGWHPRFTHPVSLSTGPVVSVVLPHTFCFCSFPTYEEFRLRTGPCCNLGTVCMEIVSTSLQYRDGKYHLLSLMVESEMEFTLFRSRH